MKKHMYSILYVIGVLLPLSTFAQDLPQPIDIKSPNAASLGKYGDVPVSYYTGSPNVSVPLYALNDYGIPLNISLSHDASGVRVNNMPGWVGQNWSLQAGGVISRTTKGKSTDEGWYATSTSGFASFMHPTTKSVLNNPNWDTETFFHYLQTVSGGMDTEPDIFTFNFMGHTGKFFFDLVSGEWKVSSSSNLKIITDLNENTYPFNESTVPFNHEYEVTTPSLPAHKTLYRITIIDEQGNIYIFGNTDNSIEYSVAFLGQTNRQWEANSWYLTQVYDRFNNLVYSFDYERGDYIGQFYGYERSEGWSVADGSPGFNITECTDNTSRFGIYSGDLISPVYLKKIHTIRGDITFNRAESHGHNYTSNINLRNYLRNKIDSAVSGSNPYWYYYLLPYTSMEDALSKLKWPKLTSITGLKKIINLTYNDIAGALNNDRLFLMGVAVDDKQYSFEYNNLGQLPDYLSKAVDHWGYYRGSYTFSPSGNAAGTNNFGSYYAARSVSTTHAKMGALTKLTYPTKGWTTFEWESNTYSSYVSDDKVSLISSSNTNAGGLRIKRLRNNDNKGNEIVKNYKYVKNYVTNQASNTSSGILERKPKYYWENFSFISHQNNAYVLDEDLFSTMPSLPLSNASGTHIGYSEVVEILPNNGYTVYRYTSNENTSYRDEYNAYSLNPDLTPYAVYNDKGMLRGKLREIETRDMQNLRKSRTLNSYNYNNALYVRGFNISVRNCPNTGVGFIKGSAYKTYFFDHNLTKEESYEYDANGNSLKNETEYHWAYYPNIGSTIGDQFLQSRKTQSYSSLGSSDEEFYQEFYKYNFEESNAINDVLILENHFALIQTDLYKNTSKISSKKLEYNYFGSTDILPKQLSVAKGDDNLEVINFIDRYNPVTRELEAYHTKDGMYTYILNVDNYPVIKLEGQKLTSSQESYLFNTTKNNISAQINSNVWYTDNIVQVQQQARNYFGNHMLTSYTYNPSVGISSITDPRGFTMYYNYDTNERLRNIRDDDKNVLKQFIYNLKAQ